MVDQKKMSEELVANIAEVIEDAIDAGAQPRAVCNALIVNVAEMVSDLDPKMREKMMYRFVKLLPEACAKFDEGRAIAENRRVQ
jgi:hypothetical protein